MLGENRGYKLSLEDQEGSREEGLEGELSVCLLEGCPWAGWGRRALLSQQGHLRGPDMLREGAWEHVRAGLEARFLDLSFYRIALGDVPHGPSRFWDQKD